MDQSLLDFRHQVRQFAREQITPIADQIEKEDRFPESLWPKLGTAGLLGVTVPKEYGGLGMSYFAHVIAMEEISRASAAVGFSYAAHANICVDNLYKNGNEQQRQKYLPKLISGEHMGGLSMSEPDAGSDVVGSMACWAKADGDRWIANGTKKWATNGPDSDIMIVYMRTADKDAGSRCMSGFIVEKGMAGYSHGESIDKLGMRGVTNSELYFKDCAIPPENLLGEVNQGVGMLMTGLDSERLILAGGPLGIMRAALDVVVPYALERKQFGQPIGNFQMVQQKIADMYTHYRAAQAMVHEAAREFDHNSHRGRDAAAGCLFASQAATQAALDAIQILGGRGYLNTELPSRLLRDAKIYEIGGGTNEIRRMVIARDLFKQAKDA